MYFVYHLPNLFHVCEKKTELDTYEINYWQRKCNGLPWRRLAPQEMPFTFSKVNKCMKKLNPHKKEKIPMKGEGILQVTLNFQVIYFKSQKTCTFQLDAH